jgi:MoaA/NifB/PqqE/SkfB family radical SAM enzyme
MRYDIEADWKLLNTCNYRCAYCFDPLVKLEEKLTVFAEPEVWRRALDRTGLTWLLHLTGGEPTVYPRFAELCQLLTATHYISLNSNLTGSSIVDIAKRVDPARLSFINAGLHAEERERRKGLGKFLKHAACLKERNFPVFISIVSTPDVLSRIDEIIALTAPIGLTPIPKLLRGTYNGKNYPGAYTAEEKLRFIEFAARARESYGPFLRVLRKRPSVNVFEDENYVDGMPRFKGRMCSAGERFVDIRPDGEIYRCQVKQSNYLGNILDGSFRPLRGKTSCDSTYCFYFCLKYSDAPKPFSMSYLRDTKLSQRIRKSAGWRIIRGRRAGMKGGLAAGEARKPT